MKVLFSALHFANFRNFESVVRLLAERGHHVQLVADEPETLGGQALVERLAAEYPTITYDWFPSPAREPWFPFARKVRYALDYVRFLAPRYDDAPKLRLRNIERAPRLVRWLTSGVGRLLVGHRAVVRALTSLERAMPPSAAAQAYVESQRPDVVLLTSLTFSRSFAMEQLKAARASGVPVGACIMSWDHLSSKALLHIAPDLTLVWNDMQKKEAVEMHGLADDRVLVTGAQCYDQWFDRRPARTRDAFCHSVGLDPSRRCVLYVCSAMSPAPDPVEPHFVRQWVGALRSGPDPALRDAGVLIRPHPERMREWQGVSLEGLDNVVLHGRSPIDGDAKADYFDSLYHSDAVVGLCTSAFLEAAIVGRPVLTLLLPAYRIHQSGMAHFRYLTEVEGGLLHTALDLPSHIEQLGAAIRTGSAREGRNQRFVTAFIRPQGLDSPATPVFVESVERLAQHGRGVPVAPIARSSIGAALSRVCIGWVARASTVGIGRWLLMDVRDSRLAQGRREKWWRNLKARPVGYCRRVARRLVGYGRGAARRLAGCYRRVAHPSSAEP